MVEKKFNYIHRFCENKNSLDELDFKKRKNRDLINTINVFFKKR